MPDDQTLRVDLLGPPVVEWLGQPLQVDTRKAVAILAVLAAALSDGSGPVARDRLATMLWPDADESRARGSLRRTLSVLLSASGDAVHTDRMTVELRSELVSSDVVTFRELARSDEREDLARAVGLIRGEFVAGLTLRDCLPFELWAAQTSQALTRELGSLLERLVLDRIRHRERHAALADAVRWLELDPLHEPAHRAVMRLLAWTGRRQEALDQYARCVRMLGDELGIAPVRATTQVFNAIRTGTLEPSGARSSGPRPPSAVRTPVAGLPFVGRDESLSRLREAISTGRSVVVTGETGVGRSRLVESFVAEHPAALVARAHSGEAALSLAPIADLVRDAVGRLGVAPHGLPVELSRLVPDCLPRQADPPIASVESSDQLYDAVLRLLATAGAPVVMEDVHLLSAASADVVTYLLYRLDRLSVPLVLTWRDPGLPLRHPLRTALATPRVSERVVSIPLGRLSVDDVRALVSAAGSAVDPALLWAETDGLPLVVVAAIRSGGDVLPRSVRDVFTARLAEVSDETAQVLAALAVHGGVVEPIVLRLTSGRGDLETVEAIEEAMGAGLVREEGPAIAFTHQALCTVTYDSISLVRRRLLHARAAEALLGTGDAPQRAAAVARHFHESGRDDLAADWAWSAAQRAAALYAHEETLLHTETAAAFGRDDGQVALTRAMAQVALARYEEALVTLRRAASLTPASDLDNRVRIGRLTADVHVRRGEWDLAGLELRSAVDLLDDLDPTPRRAHLLADQAAVASRSGDRAGAARHVAAARAAYPGPDAFVHDVAGLVALAAGDIPAATAAFQEALAADPDEVLRVALLNNLGRAYAAADQVEAGVSTARLALEIGQSHRDRHRLAALHANMADRLRESGQEEEAMTHLKASAALMAEVGTDPLERPDVWTLTSW